MGRKVKKLAVSGSGGITHDIRGKNAVKF